MACMDGHDQEAYFCSSPFEYQSRQCMHPKKFFRDMYLENASLPFQSSKDFSDSERDALTRSSNSLSPTNEKQINSNTESKTALPHFTARYGLSVSHIIQGIAERARDGEEERDIIIVPSQEELDNQDKIDQQNRHVMCDKMADEGTETMGESFPIADSTLPDSTSMSHVLIQKRKEKRWSLGTHNLCQVCSDKAAGFYCGAFVCEACKKFFIRASKQEKLRYVCMKSQNCEITKENRVQCQYCRYQKCLSLNMIGTNKETKHESDDKKIENIPCQICSAPSSGFHFGALTCEGCKGFFRRMAKERETKQYRCSKDQKCEVTSRTRNSCRACRYKKCLDVGMSMEASRIGRQPNSVKHAINLELQKSTNLGSGIDFKTLNRPDLDFSECRTNTSQIDSAQEYPSRNESNSMLKESNFVDECIAKEGISSTSCYSSLSTSNFGSGNLSFPNNTDCSASNLCVKKVKLDPEKIISTCCFHKDNNFSDRSDYVLMKQSLEKINAELIKTNLRVPEFEEASHINFDSKAEVWDFMMAGFNINSSLIIKCLKQIPGIRTIDVEDRILLLQSSVYPVSILNYSRVYNMDTKDYNYFNYTPYEHGQIIKFFPETMDLIEHFHHAGQLTRAINFDDIEYTCLTVMLLCNPDIENLKCKDLIKTIQNNTIAFLEEYESKTFHNGSLRFGLLMLRIGEFHSFALKHNLIMGNLLSNHKNIKMPPLFSEMFGKQLEII